VGIFVINGLVSFRAVFGFRGDVRLLFRNCFRFRFAVNRQAVVSFVVLVGVLKNVSYFVTIGNVAAAKKCAKRKLENSLFSVINLVNLLYQNVAHLLTLNSKYFFRLNRNNWHSHTYKGNIIPYGKKPRRATNQCFASRFSRVVSVDLDPDKETGSGSGLGNRTQGARLEGT
jgi:hypothetical protein